MENTGNMSRIEKRGRFLINFAYFMVWIGVGYLILRYALPILMPFVIAFCIAYGLRRPIRAIHAKTGLNKKALSFITVLIFYSFIGLILFYGSLTGFRWLANMIEDMPAFFYEKIVPVLEYVYRLAEEQVLKLDPSLFSTLENMYADFLKSLGTSIKDLSVTLIGVLSNTAANIPGTIIKLLFMIISSIFITVDYDRFSGFILAQFKGENKKVAIEIKSYVFDTLFVCVKSYGIIMSITFIELSVGLTLIGIENSIFIALLIAIFDILPVLGTGGVMIPWTIINIVQGEFRMALSLFAIYAIVTVIRNIIEPKIVGGNLGIHPVVTLASMFAGATLFGAVGLFGFPIGISLIRHLNDSGIIHLYNPVYNGIAQSEKKTGVDKEEKVEKNVSGKE